MAFSFVDTHAHARTHAHKHPQNTLTNPHSTPTPHTTFFVNELPGQPGALTQTEGHPILNYNTSLLFVLLQFKLSYSHLFVRHLMFADSIKWQIPNALFLR